MSYVDNNLVSGERVISRAKIHPAVLFSSDVYLLLAIFFYFDGLGFLLKTLGFEGLSNQAGFTGLVFQIEQFTGFAAHKIVAVTFLIIFVITFSTRLKKLLSTEIALTTARVIIKVGLFRQDMVEVQLSKIETTTVKQTTFARLFNYGTLGFIGSGGIGNYMRFVAEPLEFHNTVQAQIKKDPVDTEAYLDDVI